MKELSNTKVTVRLRKVEDRKEWYVYIESYPVFVPGKKAPQRIREYLNRSVTTVEWDRKRTSRTEADGTKNYKPKRDDNGIIVCRSEKDQDSMLYAEYSCDSTEHDVALDWKMPVQNTIHPKENREPANPNY